MEFFKIRRDIPFMKNALIFNVISFLTFAAAVFFLFQRGLHLSVEFTGGTVMEVGYTQTVDVEKVRSTVAGLGFSDVQVQSFGTSRDIMIRLPAQKGVSWRTSDKVLASLKGRSRRCRCGAPNSSARGREELATMDEGDGLVVAGSWLPAFLSMKVRGTASSPTA